MSWIEQNDQKRLLQWVEEHSDGYAFRQIDTRLESYYEKFDNRENIQEYGFATIPELDAYLKRLWGEDKPFVELRKICEVAALKRKPRADSGDHIADQEESDFVVPDFTYTF